MPRQPRWLGAIAAVAVTAACTGGSTPAPPAAGPSRADPVAVVRLAPARTLASGSSRIALTVESSSGTTLRGTGAFDYRTGDGVLDQQITASGRSTRQRVLIVKGICYVSVPVAGGKYFRLDLRSLLARSGGGYDQAAILRLLGGVTGTLESVGTEDVRGVPATRLRGQLDLDRALAAVTDPRVRAGLARLRAALQLPRKLPVEVWVDRAGLVRRLRQTYQTPAQQVGGVAVPATRTTTTVDYYDFGVRVAVRPPPAGQVLG